MNPALKSSVRILWNYPVEECRNRIQCTSKDSQQGEGIIINYSFQEKKRRGLWYCLTDHAFLGSSSYGMVP